MPFELTPSIFCITTGGLRAVPDLLSAVLPQMKTDGLAFPFSTSSSAIITTSNRFFTKIIVKDSLISLFYELLTTA
ncbi:MAG TPA: hypothetical protein VE076_04195 [Nitrososphaeraceae archaeon]|nr:hypothetical protein [Nitrososphaeraceae archaeon]